MVKLPRNVDDVTACRLTIDAHCERFPRNILLLNSRHRSTGVVSHQKLTVQAHYGRFIMSFFTIFSTVGSAYECSEWPNFFEAIPWWELR